MRILLVNNFSSYIGRLKKKLKGHDLDVVGYSRLGRVDLRKYDCIFLSGGHLFSVLWGHSRLEKEIDLVRSCGKPIFGICFGFELICYAYGGKLVRLGRKVKGFREIRLGGRDKIFSGLKKRIKVFEAHRWAVKNCDKLRVLSRSSQRVEVVRHPKKLIYGVQFHPERSKGEAEKLIDNFLRMVEEKR